MIDRYLQLTIDIILSGSSIIMLITVGGIIPLMASVLSILWFLNLFKLEIQNKHQGSIKSWAKWFLNMRKKN